MTLPYVIVGITKNFKHYDEAQFKKSLSHFLPQFEPQHQVQLGDQEAKLT